MLYADADMLSRDRRRAEGEEDNVDNGGDNKHVNRCVRGLRRADSGDEGWRRLWWDNNINNDEEESGSHPTLWTMVTCELAERLHSSSCNRWQAEAGEGNIDDGGDNKHINGRFRGLHQADTRGGQHQRLQHNGDNNDNNDNVEEGGSHPTLWTTVTHELAVWLRSAGIPAR